MTMTSTPARQQAAHDQVRAELADHTMFELMGGEVGVHALVDRFYGLMDTDPRFASLRDLHQHDLSPMRQALYEFLSGWLGGPPLYVMRNGSPCITAPHSTFAIGQTEIELWMECMQRAMDDTDVPERYSHLLMPALGDICEMLRNDGSGPGGCSH